MSSPQAASTSPESAAASASGVGVLVWLAVVVALVGLAGSLYLSLGMGLKACPLCFYQRTFMMSVIAVLAMGLNGLAHPQRLSALALPLAVAGLGVALFHVSLELREKLECPAGAFGLGSAPQQSAAAFLVLTALLLLDALASAAAGHVSWFACVAGLILGAVLAYASTIANPPPPVPRAPYPDSPDVCRPPYRPAT